MPIKWVAGVGGERETTETAPIKLVAGGPHLLVIRSAAYRRNSTFKASLKISIGTSDFITFASIQEAVM